jgi:hypothetical protein
MAVKGTESSGAQSKAEQFRQFIYSSNLKSDCFVPALAPLRYLM